MPPLGYATAADTWNFEEAAVVRRKIAYYLILGGIAESVSTYCDRCYRSVVCPSVCTYIYVCRLSHSCILLKPLDVMRCHLAGTCVWSHVTLLVWGPGLPREGEIWGSEPSGRSDAATSEVRPLYII